MSIIARPNMQIPPVKETILGRNDGRLIFIQSPAAAPLLFPAGLNPISSLAIDSSVSLCLPASSVIIARVGHFSRGQFSPFRLRRQWSKEERWLMMLFFSLFHKSSDYRLIGNETAAARSAKSNLRGNNDRSIKESDVLQLQDAFWGIVFLESENENPPFNRRNRLENVTISCFGCGWIWKFVKKRVSRWIPSKKA